MSRDTFLMDEILVLSLTELIQFGLSLMCSLIGMVIVIPYLIAPFVFILLSLFLFKKYIISITRDCKKLELVSRSNLFSNITSLINGLIVIRNQNNE
mmetsp:Transcript_32622/g.5910  ORF Transcript_32622/g.5910 Transcript_32622/m.5910 type:complete len:97 (+) Transcript_32622:1864-2154(+)